MLQLTASQKEFLLRLQISLSSVFDASWMTTKDYKIQMKKEEKIIAIWVVPCKRSWHTIRTRSWHCLQCNTWNLNFLQRYYKNWIIYTAFSKKWSIFKVWLTNNIQKRQIYLNNEWYGQQNDWEIIYHAQCDNVWKIEFEVQNNLKNYNRPISYVKCWKETTCYEIFSCNYETIKKSINLVKNKYPEQWFVNEFEDKELIFDILNKEQTISPKQIAASNKTYDDNSKNIEPVLSTINPTNSPISSERARLEAKTLDELVDEFLFTKKSSETKKAYQQDILVFFAWINVHTVQDLLQIPLYELSRVVLLYTESFKKTDEYHTDRIANPRTINRKAYALSSFFEFIVATYGYPRNPVKVFIPYSTPQKTSTDALEQSELEAIRTTVTQKFATAVSQKAKIFALQQLLILSCMMLSMRRNEVAHLRWKDLDWWTSVITVFGKGQKLKYLPLPPTLITYLREFQDLKLSLEYISDYIFSPLKNPTTENFAKPISGSYLFQLIQKITKKLQLEGKIDHEKKITPHSFRTTFVKLALERKQTDIEIMNATGHSTSAMVKYYDSRSPVEANAAKVMNDFF